MSLAEGAPPVPKLAQKIKVQGVIKINAGAVLQDLAGNSLNTTSSINDDTTLTVNVNNTARIPYRDVLIPPPAHRVDHK